MARTTAIIGRAVLAVGLGVAASSAHAVPMVFDFTGAVISSYHATGSVVTTDWSVAGQSVTGRFVIETDGLTRGSQTGSTGTTVTYADPVADGMDVITTELLINGVSYDVDINPGDRGGISMTDAVDGADRLSITNKSAGYWGTPMPHAGPYSSRYLTLTWPGTSPAGDFIDLTQAIEPLDLVPLMTALMPVGFYSELTFNCADDRCATTGSTSTNFVVTSLRVQAPGVPEPGTLALFAVGLLGGAVARRSTAKGR